MNLILKKYTNMHILNTFSHTDINKVNLYKFHKLLRKQEYKEDGRLIGKVNFSHTNNSYSCFIVKLNIALCEA